MTVIGKTVVIVGLLGGIILIVSAVLGFRVLPDYIKRKVEEEVSLRPLSDTWKKWANIDKPLFSDFYVFHVTNPDEVESNGDLPILQQIGPFSFRQRRRKINIQQLEGEGTVQYEQETWYFYDVERSSENVSENTMFNILNLPYVSVLTGLNAAAPESIPAALPVLDMFNQTLIRRNVNIRQLLFEGMDVTPYVLLFLGSGQPVPDDFADSRFGLYKGRNGSRDGVYKIHTGVGDSSNFGQILTWNGRNYLGLWNHMSFCDRVNGSDGTLFPFPLTDKHKEGEVIQIFSSDIYRSLDLKFEKEEKVQGIKGYKFTLPKEVLEDPRVNPNNRCFCNETVAECLYAGAIDISAIRNAPFAFSTPLFYLGEQNYSIISGLSPIKNLHETFLVIEPTSGALLKVNKRIQLNMNYKPIMAVPGMANSTGLMFPIMWVDENTEFTEENAKELKDKLLNPKKAVETWRWVGVGLGIALMVGALILFYFMVKRNRATATI